MTQPDSILDKEKRYIYSTISLVACSMLMYEILLTRICALRLLFHFGFLIVSNCLLGIGASGSMVFVFQKTFARRDRYWIWLFSILYVLSLCISYICLISLPIPQGIRFHSAHDILLFSVFNFVSAFPFFFSGSVIGLILTFNAGNVNRAYGLDLLGAGIGCLFCPLLLWKTGAGGCFVFLSLLAILAAVVSAPVLFRRRTLFFGVLLIITGIVLLPNIDTWFPVPVKTKVKVSEETELELQKNLIYSKWSATSRVDVFTIKPKRYHIFGLGIRKLKKDIPEQKYIAQDGSAGTSISNFSENPSSLKVISMSLYNLAPMLKENPRVFIVGVGGGNDVWAAKINGARYIKGIELNKQILDAHRNLLKNYSTGITQDPSIELINDEGRSALMRDKSKYDIIQMSGIDTWTSLMSGAYVLAENYLYTTEAIRTMYNKLENGGVLSITRFARNMEVLRLLSNIFKGLHDQEYVPTSHSIVCVGVRSLRTILVKKGQFTPQEIAKLEQFVQEGRHRFFYHPEKQIGSIVERFIRTDNRDEFIDEFPRNISPTTDNQPYFFNFTKWNNPLSSTPFIKESTTVSQGNPMFIFGQLILSSVLALLFILLPVALSKRKNLSRKYAARFFIYFSGLGLGFITLEVSLMQKLVLLLGHPIYSITVTLFSMLVFTGIGSILSRKWFSLPTRRAWIVPAGLAIYVPLIIIFSPQVVEKCIALPLFVRILVTGAVLAPVGLLLGIPFAYGIKILDRFNPSIVPWAWAVNGCLTVIGSILTVILSMNFGFNVAMSFAVIVYFLSFVAIDGLNKIRTDSIPT